jgi:uncharacterized membrane protein
MNESFETASYLLENTIDYLSGPERPAKSVSHHTGNNPDTNVEIEENLTVGQRLADRVTLFGGSWTFLICFGVLLFAWVLVNSFLLPQQVTFDPYPYIFLNLVLSMMSAVQAPVIMMSQNRQDQKDRLAMMHDYEVNLKTEREIQSLHNKLDRLTALHQAEMQRLLGLLEQYAGENVPLGKVKPASSFEGGYSAENTPGLQWGFKNEKRHPERGGIFRQASGCS